MNVNFIRGLSASPSLILEEEADAPSFMSCKAISVAHT